MSYYFYGLGFVEEERGMVQEERDARGRLLGNYAIWTDCWRFPGGRNLELFGWVRGMEK